MSGVDSKGNVVAKQPRWTDAQTGEAAQIGAELLAIGPDEHKAYQETWRAMRYDEPEDTLKALRALRVSTEPLAVVEDHEVPTYLQPRNPMSLLQSITQGTRQLPPRVLLYGPHGIGKNTWAAGAPRPIVIQTEQGSDEIGMDRLPLCRSYEDVIAQIGALYQDQHDYETVVLDTLDWLEPLIWERVCKDDNVTNIEKVQKGFGKGYTIAMAKWREIADGLKALREQRNMAVIMLAHSEVKTYNAPDTEPYDRYQLRLHKYASGFLYEWSDAVLFAGYKVFTRTTELKGADINKGIGTGERVLHTQERPTHLAKNRYAIPEPMPFPEVGGFDLFSAAVANFYRTKIPAVASATAK